MKKHIKLSLWLIFAAIAVPLVPTMAIAQADKRTQRLRFRKNYLDAKALYEKRQREGASPSELQKLEKEMKQARRKWIGVVLGIATAAVAATGAAAYAARGKGEAPVDPSITMLINDINSKQDMWKIENDIFKIRVGHGIDINSKDAQGMTPLHHAAQAGYDEAITLLIQHKADAKATDKQGRTPLMLYATIENPDKTIIALLKQHGAETNAKDREGQTAADYYATSYDNRGAFSDMEIQTLLRP